MTHGERLTRVAGSGGLRPEARVSDGEGLGGESEEIHVTAIFFLFIIVNYDLILIPLYSR